VQEIGYQQAVGQYMWWLYENETTPELVWPQSVYVYDQMRKTDSQVGSILRAVNLLVLRTPWRIDPNGARDEVVQFVADDLGLPIVGQSPKAPPRTKDRFSWKDHLAEALLMLPIGYSYFEQVYRIDPDGDHAHLRKLALRPARTIEYINVAQDGGLISIKQYWIRTGERPQPIPVEHLVAYIHAKEGGNWLGTSILRNCYKNWLLKDRLLRVQAQTIERNGMGIPLYVGQEGATDLSGGLAMAKGWRAGDAAGTAIPYGAILKLVGVEGTLPDAEPAIRYHDESIAKTVLAHFLNLGQQMGTGSYALGATLGDFFTLGVQTVGQQIADTANMHVVEDLVDVNWGPQEPAPRIVFDEIGSRQAATAQALKLLIDAGVIHSDDILEESTRQQYGLPPRDPNAPPPGPLPGLTRETLTGPAPGGAAPAPAVDTKTGAASVAASATATVDPDAGLRLDDLAARVEALESDLAEDDDDLDEDTEALLVALAEFAGEVTAAVFNPSLHPRNPKGTVGAGKFRSTVDRLIDALKQHASSGGKGDPFSGFDREQLRRAAVKRGITLKRGASRDDISKALIADLRTGRDNPIPMPSEPSKPDPVKAREVEVENRIREAYRAVLSRQGRKEGGSEWVGLADLRKELDESASRREVDAALKRLAVSREPGSANVVPESNQKTLTQADRDAAVHFGDQGKHAISFEDASPQPIPGLAAPARTNEARLATNRERQVVIDKARTVREVQIENRIREAYRAAYQDAHGSTPDNYVGLAAIRDHLGESMSRKEVDAALQRMAIEAGGRRDGSVQIIPVENSRALTQADRDSALRMGGEDHHAIKIPDPSPRPLPIMDQPSAPANGRSATTDEVVTGLAEAKSRQEGRALVADLSLAELKAVANALQVAPQRNKADYREAVVDATVGTRVDHAGIRNGGWLTPTAKPPTASTPDATLATLRDLGSHDEAWSAASKMTVPQLRAVLTHMGYGQGLSGRRKGYLVDRLAGTWPEMRMGAP